MTISPSTLPDWTVRSPYNQTLGARGCTGPCVWSTQGTLPPGVSVSPLTGQVSGTPTTAGTFQFTVLVADTRLNTGSQSYTVVIHDSPKITTTTLPEGVVGTAYSQTLAVSNGTPPFTFAVTGGSLPAGLSLNQSSGVISGTPNTGASSSFTVTATDQAQAATSQTYSLLVRSAAITITTNSLPTATVGVAYSQALAAAGGKPPYSWSLTSGALPGGLSLNASTGVISGTPTGAGSFTFNVHVTDSASATGDQLLSILVSGASGGSTLTLNGVPASAGSGQQVPFSIALSSASSRTVTGQVALTFQPGTTVSRDDPAVQFASGGRTLSFTIPAGSTQASFSGSPAAFQTGTVAGTIKLNVTSDLAGAIASSSTVVPQAAPVISAVTVSTTSSGFQLQVAGFSNSLDLAAASFRFTAKSGQLLQTSDLTVNLATLAGQWYAAASSSTFGGQFLLLVPFTVQQGAASSLASVSVQLQNSQASSQPATANF
ncbi:MAG TPA: Ig domain-containing protein [Bryobacteraceae bacterium]|nr:Ig domain-containing protein [Bryobacteraceae bacterium]